MYSETQLLLLSGLQHLQFCRRQWALIHLEQVWSENQFTAEGRNLHDKVHDSEIESRGDVRIVRGLRLQCLRLGLVGQADVVEFISADTGVELDGVTGFWRPFPVEYKRGKTKIDDCDRVQLCAQAMCLEEMLKIPCGGIAAGALFYGRPRRREQVVLDTSLRDKTEALAQEMHQLHAAGQTPKAKYQKKCGSCSLYETCLPKTTGIKKDVAGYLAKALEF
ncbi:MAG: CRISPR-associated protein Cas4 [Phycisphaerae bacterium]|nr:CRISPR-associated protein Cas4 [Phycisphaerae bacterium]